MAFFISIVLSAQESTDRFTESIRQELGDLNADGLTDSISVSMDITDDTRPLKLEVFFGLPYGKYELKVSTTKIIEAQYPIEKEGMFNGRQIPYFVVKNGDLEMQSDIYSGTAIHRFKYMNGRFELIYFSKVEWDGKETTTETIFDLLSGKFIKQSQLLNSNEYFDVDEQNIPLMERPKLASFIPFQHELY